MFEIDLLKGQGKPARKTPADIMIVLATAALPVLAAVVMSGMYLNSAAAISSQKRQITDYDKKIGEFSAALAHQETITKQKGAIYDVLTEVASSVGRHVQWSPILMAVVESMPNSLVLTGLEVKTTTTKKKIPKKGSPGQTVDVTVPIRSLLVRVSGKSSSGHDEVIKDFSDRLRSSKVLGPRLENIRVSKQDSGARKGVEGSYYELDCIFKSEL